MYHVKYYDMLDATQAIIMPRIKQHRLAFFWVASPMLGSDYLRHVDPSPYFNVVGLACDNNGLSTRPWR